MKQVESLAIPGLQGGIERPTLRESQLLALRASRELGPLIPEIRIDDAGDGLVSITMPAPWAWLLCEQLALQANQMREELRLAHVRALEKRFEDERVKAEIATRVKEKDKAISEAYLEHRARGVRHKEAVKKVRDTMAKNWPLELLERTITKRVNSKKREERQRKIHEAYLSGISAKMLAERYKVSLFTVYKDLRQMRVKDTSRNPRPGGPGPGEGRPNRS